MDGTGTSATDRARASYSDAFGAEPDVVALAPGRVNLIGDHTDYCDGYALPVALEIGCACAVGEADARTLDVFASDLALREVLDTSYPFAPEQFASSDAWFRYIVGVFELMRWANRREARGVQMAFAGDVPVGGGLASSAALEVAAATALEAHWDLEIDPLVKALVCQRAEHEFGGVACGIMDQFVAVKGRRGEGLLIDCRELSVRPVPLPEARDATFVLIDSGVERANRESAYAARRLACETAAEKLGVPSLRDADQDAYAPLNEELTDEERRAVEHVVTENQRVLDFADALGASDLARAGENMNDSHRSLSEVLRVSCPEVDGLVADVRTADGVLGARMTGGGFGGWVVALVRAQNVDGLVAQLGAAHASMRLVSGDGARVV